MTRLLLSALLTGCAAMPAAQDRHICYLLDGVGLEQARGMHAHAARHFASHDIVVTGSMQDYEGVADLEVRKPGCDFVAHITDRTLVPWAVGSSHDWQVLVQTNPIQHAAAATTPSGTLVHELKHVMGCGHPPGVPRITSCGG